MDTRMNKRGWNMSVNRSKHRSANKRPPRRRGRTATRCLSFESLEGRALLAGLVNGDFHISDSTNAGFGWLLQGDAAVAGEQAVLNESGEVFSQFSQTFDIPSSSNLLKFTITQNALVNAGDIPDAFDVKLLDATTGNSLVPVAEGLADTHSFLNIQSTGEVFFGRDTSVPGATTSGQVVDLQTPLTINVNLHGIAAATGRLQFGLLGSSPFTSSISFDDVILVVAADARDDSYTVDEHTVLVRAADVGVLANDLRSSSGAAPTITLFDRTSAHGAAVSIASDGSFTYDPLASAELNKLASGQSIVDTFKYVIRDDMGNVDVATVTVTINGVNEPPNLSVRANSLIAEHQLLTLSLSASDPDPGDTISYSIPSGFQPGMILFGTSGNAFRWTPSESQDGSYIVVFRAQDNHNGTDDRTVTITVTEVNEAPVLPNPGDKNVLAGEKLSIRLEATDADVISGFADVITYAISSGQLDGMTLDANTGAFEWTPTEAQVGQHVVTFLATDQANTGDSKSITITVAGVNQAPTDISLSNSTVNENASGSVIGDITVTDPDGGQTHSFALSDNRFEIVAGKLQLTTGTSLDFETEPSIPLQITATDSGSPALSIEKSFMVGVNNVNDPPSRVDVSNSTVQENLSEIVVGTLSAIDQDVGQTHTFSVTDSRFEIVDTTLKLKAGEFLSLDNGATTNVDVTATDSGSPTQSLLQTLVITVVSNPRPWQYTPQPVDSNADGLIVPLDALRIINQLNNRTIVDSAGALPRSRPATSTLPYYDVSGDGFCTPNDVLRVINFLNARQGEGESLANRNSMAFNSSIVSVADEIDASDIRPAGSTIASTPTVPSNYGSVAKQVDAIVTERDIEFSNDADWEELLEVLTIDGTIVD